MSSATVLLVAIAPNIFFRPKTQPALVIDSHLTVSGLAFRLKDLIFRFQSEDDVLTGEFALSATVFVNCIEEDTPHWSSLQTECNNFMPDRKLLSIGSNVSLPKVPTTNAFRFEPLSATTEDGDSLAIAVPSRLYFEQTEEKPLNGKRIGIKDNIQLVGPQDETADIVKKLIHQGAVVIGKQRLNAFAGSEKPPDQCIDYFSSWNPRADGYLRTAGSTSGGGSSIAGYNWMDYAVGTDNWSCTLNNMVEATGSLREPARVCVLYGLKATNRIISA
ncbi:hypothetical protein BS50DRAFT_590519 [Corynespora cassiicola Philippines]|uniref:Amidase domain-containing protein n=1 Tax=Corynespora cassiicola Philippines TaxID=1448308 RepID=A0A2T2NH30_CORCC|nr:hypothetical protein BS50DRAFT_590519 [Corynespora cassiicola Philippines]